MIREEYAVFVDYHKPARLHPLRGIMHLIWRKFEPFAAGLLESEIEAFADDGAFTWSKETFFGGLYQKIVATRTGSPRSSTVERACFRQLLEKFK